MIPRPCACYVKEVPLGVVNFFQVSFVSHSFNSLLKGNDLVITGHNDNRPKFEPFCQMHCADGDLIVSRLDIFVQNPELCSCLREGGTSPVKLSRRTDKQADLVRLNPFAYPCG